MNLRLVWRLTVWAALSFGAACYAQSTVAVPSTGAKNTPTGRDANWSITSNTVAGETATGPASIVTTLPGGWTTPALGSAWIAPDSNQTNATRPGSCCMGAVRYQVTFNVTDPTTAKFQMTIAGDESITVWLNGEGQDSRIVYSTDNATYDKPETVTIEQGKKLPNLTFGGIGPAMFVAGSNVMIVEVLNFGGGPTGLYISTALPGGGAPSTYIDSAPADGAANAAPDPIDSGSGQFYDTETDFALGGLMRVGFERYYSSQLSKTGFTSALGTNWMGTYDISALVSPTKAQVLLFGGRVVTFASSAGAWQLQSPLNVGYQFAAVTGGFKFMDPRTLRIYTFSPAGTLTKIEDRNGNAITVTPGANGPARVADGLGRTLTFTYSGGNLTTVADQSGRTLTLTYTGGLLATATDNLKAVTNYAYATVGTNKGLLTKETLPLGNAPVSQTYDASGRVTAQTDGNNNTTKISYDPGATTTITDANNSITRHKNDDIGDIAQLSDPLGGAANVAYDSSRRRTSVTDKNGGTWKRVYHPQTGYVSAVTDASGNTTSYSYTAQTQAPFVFYVLSGITYSDGATASMTYDNLGNLLTSTDADSGVTSFAYDSQGNVTKWTDPLGQSTIFKWNADGTKASTQDPLGNVTKFEYDSSKKLSKNTDPNGSAVSYAYDGDGRVTNATYPNQAIWTVHYDPNGKIDSLTTPSGGKNAFTYSPTEKIATSTNPLGNVTRYSYDKLDRLSKIQNGAGEAVSYTYDANGRVTAAADNAGPRQAYTYNAEGRLIAQTDATGRVISHSYDQAGRPVSITSPGGNVTTLAYDARGNIMTRTDPAGDQYTQTYDAVGRLLSVTSPGGSATSFQRDAAGRPVSFTSANGNVWTMSYDPDGRVSTIADPLGNSTSYTYQGARRTRIDFPLGSASYTYDTSARLTKTSYSDGTVINKTFSALGHVTSADGVTVQRNLVGLPTNVNGIAVTVDGGGKPLTFAYATGKTITYTYDVAGRVNSVSDWTRAKTAITYDAASRRASHTFPNGITVTYGYDADGRRNSITHGTLGSIQLTFDAAGRTTSADRNLPIAPTLQPASQQLSYNAAGQLATATVDSMGRVTAQGNRSYTWNLATQLTGFADTVNSAKITYDGMGEMNSSTATGVAQNYVFNYAMKYPGLQIVRQGGTDLRYYVYLPDGELLYSIEASDGSRRFYHFDEMGDTAFLTDNSGAVTDSYGITPYGEIADHVGTVDNPFTWQGQYGAIQEGAGLYYMRSRHYDASTARFLSPDPLMNAHPQASEPYAYAHGNPLLFRDPFGSDASLPPDLADLNYRYTVELVTNFFDPQPDFAFLQLAVTLVQANPDWDFTTLLNWAYAIAPYPPPPDPPVFSPPPPPDPPAVSMTPVLESPPAVTPALAPEAPPLAGGAVNLGSNCGPLGCVNPSGPGGGLWTQDGAGLWTQDGAGLWTQDGAGLWTQDGAGAVSTSALSFTPHFSAYREVSGPARKSKNNKK